MSMDFRNMAIGFIGGGNLARAIATPLIKRGIINPRNVWVSDESDATLYIWNRMDEKTPVNVTLNNLDVLLSSNIIFLSIEPQYFDNAIQQALHTSNVVDSIFVSIIPGVTLEEIKNNSDVLRHRNVKLIRTMPNMPVKVSQGIICKDNNHRYGRFLSAEILVVSVPTGVSIFVDSLIAVFCRPVYVHPNEAKFVMELLAYIGKVEEISESLMNAASGLTASGPAFAYLMAEALSDGAVKNGFPRELAIKCAAQVLIGAGKMILDTGKHPGQLKDEVCSPGGTTMAGMLQLECGSVRASFINAVDAASKKPLNLNPSYYQS